LRPLRGDADPRLRVGQDVPRLPGQHATHLEAFHQAEVFWMDERSRLDPWTVTARVLRSVDALFPSREVKIVPTPFPMCTQAWELHVDDNGRWVEALAWGVYTDRVVEHVGGDPSRHIAAGVGHGLERLAMLRYGIDDARKIEGARGRRVRTGTTRAKPLPVSGGTGRATCRYLRAGYVR
jgi:phenylalanyl-tRNA synthetase alpha subunit